MDDPPYHPEFQSGNDTPLHNGTGRNETDTGTRSPQRRRPQKFKPRQKAAGNAWEESWRPAVGTLTRTKRLLLAALRVWELKHGIRD